jgi:HAMP domain-containing protein
MMSFIQNLSIRAKLISGILSIILVFLVLMFIQFRTVEHIDINQKIIASAEKSLRYAHQLSMISQAEMQNLLEILQTDEISAVETFSKSHTVNQKEIQNLYIELFSEIKLIFPDAMGMERVKAVNYLNESQTNLSNVLSPYFESVVILKTEQLKKGDKIDYRSQNRNDSASNSDVGILLIETQETFGVDRSVQLQKLFRFYKQNHEQLNVQLKELNTLIGEVLISSSNVVVDKNQNLKLLNTIFFIIAIIAVSIIYIGVSNTIARPLSSLETMVAKLSRGELPEHTIINSNDEIGKISQALNSLTDGLIKTSEFASEIGRSNFTSIYEPLSNKDVLGNSLLEMRKSLQAASEEEGKRKIEDQERKLDNGRACTVW